MHVTCFQITAPYKTYPVLHVPAVTNSKYNLFGISEINYGKEESQLDATVTVY